MIREPEDAAACDDLDTLKAERARIEALPGLRGRDVDEGLARRRALICAIDARIEQFERERNS